MRLRTLILRSYDEINIFNIMSFQKFIKLVMCVFILLFSTSLQAQNSRVEFDLFGLTCFPFQEVSQYSYNFNIYGNDSWDSYQEIDFNKKSLRLGFGARLSYWFNNNFGLRIEALSWKKNQTSYDNSVFINYSYYTFYPYVSDKPTEISYEMDSDIPPKLSYRIYALSLNGILRKKIGNCTLDFYGGFTAFHSGGELKNLYFRRTRQGSHSTFLSEEVTFDYRFDFMSLGGNLGIDLSVPIAGNFVGLFGLKYFFGVSKEPRMFVSSMTDLDDYLLPVVMQGIDEITEHSQNGILKINPSSFALSLGLGYSKQYSVSPIKKKSKFRLMLFPGVSKMSQETSYERTFSIFEDGSGQCAQNIDLFNERPVLSYGAGSSFNFSSYWAIELSYQRQQKNLNVDSGPVVLYLDQLWKKYPKYQRPQSSMKLDEFNTSLVHYFPIQGAEILVSAGMNFARLSLTVKDLYFLYFHKPLTTDFVSFSGLYSAVGSSWILGANVGIGFQFPIIGPLEGRLSGNYNVYKKASIQIDIDDIELGEVWGYGDQTLNPDELQQQVSRDEVSINLSRLKIYFALIIRF